MEQRPSWGLSLISGWVTTIEQDLARLQVITALADDSYHGLDVNGDGQIDPVA